MRTILLLALAALASAETLVCKDGRKLVYDTLELEPKTPKTALLVKHGKQLTTLKLSEVDPAELPETQRELLATFIKDKKAERVILLDDEWLNRNEHLLKKDERFAYEAKLRRNGANVIKVVNPQKVRVTLGLRTEGKGLEFSVEPKKTRILSGIPHGSYFFYFVFETEGDQELDIHQSEPVELKMVEYTLTMAPGGKEGALMTKPAGRIAVPADMRAE